MKTYGSIKTPVLSSEYCTPIRFTMTNNDVPPTLHLHKSKHQVCPYPQRISCNINLSSVPSGHQSIPEKPTSMSPVSSNFEKKEEKTSTNSCVQKELQKNEKKVVVAEENVWQDNLKYVEHQENGGSNLYITWSGTKAQLVEKLQIFKLQVREVLRTSDDSVRNVIFKSHPIARKAFTMQNQIRLRIVPPKNSHRIWLRNPSPKFLVKFETKCRLVVRKGKAESHDVVGYLLKGCLISTDQLKGNRIRVLCCEGSFMFPGGKVVEMKGVQSKSHEKASLGWITYRCKHTKKPFLIRRSWNMLDDYIFKG